MQTTRYSMSALAALLLAVGCGQSAPARVAFDLEVAGGGAKELPNDHGYVVTLSRATLHLDAVHFFSGEPLFAGRQEGLLRWVIGVAYAHPGHYQEGSAMAELLQGATVDLLGKPRILGRASGVTGSYRSARVSLASAGDNGGHLAMAAGSAVKGNHEVNFTLNMDGSLEVAGVAASTTMERAGPTAVRLVVDLKRWVERIDFAKLAGGSQPVELKAGTQAHNAFVRGVGNTSAFGFSWKTP